MSARSRTKSFLLASLFLLAFNAGAWQRGHVDRFATLPAGAAAPEGITVDAQGNVYVTTFATGPALPENLYVFNSHGRLRHQVKVEDSSTQLLGIAFHPAAGMLLVVDFGNGRVLRVDPDTGEASVFATVTGSAGLNALAFDKSGAVYISDSFQGIIWRIEPDAAGGAATPWVESDLLRTTGVPPFGANGLAFNSKGDLFVANTGNDTIVRIPVSDTGVPGTPEVFTNSVNGADGVLIDEHDNLWVCANQADEIVVIDNTGKAIAKLGDFKGVRRGMPVGLLFPASLARDGNWLYVTNLSLDLRLFGAALQTVDSQWTAQVERHTISRLRARIRGADSDD